MTSRTVTRETLAAARRRIKGCDCDHCARQCSCAPCEAIAVILAALPSVPVDSGEEHGPHCADGWCDPMPRSAVPPPAAPGLREALRANGWEPDTNVCGACFDHGSRHDLNNRCLDCSCQCFSSMTDDEIWTWQMGRLRAALAETPGEP